MPPQARSHPDSPRGGAGANETVHRTPAQKEQWPGGPSYNLRPAFVLAKPFTMQAIHHAIDHSFYKQCCAEVRDSVQLAAPSPGARYGNKREPAQARGASCPPQGVAPHAALAYERRVFCRAHINLNIKMGALTGQPLPFPTVTGAHAHHTMLGSTLCA
jgi:hypothetical protein